MKRLILTLIALAFPIASFAAGDPLRKIAKEFRKEMRSLKNPRVALLSFPYHNGKISSGSSILSERLTTYMAEVKGIRVVERNLLKKLLEEQHLSETGIVDASAAKKIGKVVGVDVLITGTLNDLEGERTELNARVIKSDTGEVIAADHIVVDRSWSDSPRFPGQAVYRSIPEAPEEKPVSNEAIEVGIPAGRGGGGSYRGGSGGGFYGGR